MERVSISLVVLIAFFCYQGFGETVSTRKQQFEGKNPLQQKEVQPKYFEGKCDEPNGRYAVSGQCDAYVECQDGVSEEKLCPDGLLFNDKVGIFTFPCQYPIDVDCTQRTKTQSAQATEDCPHQFGYYRVGSSSECGSFMNCADGRGYKLDCPLGLAFNKNTYQCDWPDQVPDCDAEAFLGFACPEESQINGVGPVESKFYRSNDCQRYFLCVSGRPRLNVCGAGQAFSELTNSCDDAANVTGCESLALEEDEPERQPIYLKTLKLQ